MSSKETKNSQIQVISRAINIMRALGHSSSGLSLGQLAKRCELPRSTVQRIISSLMSEGMVTHLGNNQGFTLGPEIQAFAATSRIEFWRSYQPQLIQLANETGETVDLAVLQGDMMLFVDQIPGRHRLRAMSEPGTRFSALVSANGKACLSLLSDDQLKQDYDLNIGQLQEIQKVRKTGLAWDINSHTPGISAVGAAFEGPDGQIYAVSIPVPSQRFEKIKDQIAQQLLQCIHSYKKNEL